MRFTPRLVASFPAPAHRRRRVERWPHRRLIVVRHDQELAVYDLAGLTTGATAPAARFPAPGPPTGADAVHPGLELAVFSGPGALHAVDASGAPLWRLGHEGGDGSCRFSADGAVVWAHVRVSGGEQWLVIDPADGRVLGRAPAGVPAGGSDHVPHPDPSRMGLAALRWGHWDGERLTVTGADDRVLLDVSPGGSRFLTVSHDQDELAIHHFPDGAIRHELVADVLPGHPQAPPHAEEEPFWDYECGFLDDETIIAGSAEADSEYGRARHWLINAATGDLTARVGYPMAICGAPIPLGGSRWLTSTEEGSRLLMWER